MDAARVGIAARVPALRSFWERRMAAMAGAPVPRTRAQVHRDRVLTDALGIGQEPLASFLSTQPAFDALLAFIDDRIAGEVDETRLGWINALQDGSPYPEAIRAHHAHVDAMAPVLDATDLAHWREQGYVVLHDAISAAQCAALAAVVHAQVGADADDAATWYAAQHRQGIMVQLFQHPALQPARRSLRIHKAFAQLHGSSDLVMTCDRTGFNPPETTRFRFPGPHLHWDAPPVAPMGFGVQAVLYLTDTPAAQGAFTCVPGFHRDADAWLRALPAGADAHAHIPHGDARPVAGRAGDLIAWHHALPHGSSPNRGLRPRVVQYLTMYPARSG